MSEWLDKLSEWTGEFFSWLLGVEGLRPEEIKRFKIFFTNTYASFGLFLLALIGVVALVVIASRREQRQFSMWRKSVLGGLRLAALVLLVLAIFLPFVRFNYVEHSKYPLVLVLDDTDSENIKDVRVKKEDLALAAEVMTPPGERKKLGPALQWPADKLEKFRRVSRAALLQKMFDSEHGEPLFDLLNDFDVRVFRVGDTGEKPIPVDLKKDFGGDLRRLCGSLKYEAKSSPIGTAIESAVGSYYGRKPFALVYIGDGGRNKGLSIRSAAASMAGAKVPLHMLIVGVAEAKDVQIEYLDANDVFFKDDKAEFRAVLTQDNCGGQTVDIILRLNGQRVASKRVTLAGPSMMVKIDYKPTKVTPKGKMDTYEVTVSGMADEFDSANNSKTKKAKTIDGKMKVLYVEDEPRWEWRVMRDMMLRDIRVGKGNYHTLLLKADERSVKDERHRYYIRKFPSPNELKEYHALIIGDVNATEFLEEQIKTINKFVGEWGGGLMMIAGDRYNPGSYTGRVNKPIEEMMPVTYRRTRPPTDKEDLQRPLKRGFNVRLTPWAAAYNFTAFDPSPKRNQKIWRDFGPFYWHADVRKLHPMAVALVVHESKKDEEGLQPLPLIAVRRYGKGRVIFVGIDETWRFRKEVGSTYHRTFWAQAVQYLGVSLLSGATRRIDLRLERKRCSVGESIDIEAVVFDRDYKPLRDDDVTIKYQRLGGEVKSIRLPRSAKEGIYRASHVPSEDGDHVFWIEDRFSKDPAKVERFLNVRQPNVERDNPAVDIERFRKIVKPTNGAVYRLNELGKLREKLTGHARTTQRHKQKPLWNTWLALLAIVCCLTAEWVMRKRWNLR